jgi:putative transposase
VNHKRVERLWRREGLKVPRRQSKRGRLWFNDGSCIRLRPKHRNPVWSYDFVADRTHDGRAIRMLTVIDEYRRECLAIEVERRLRSDDVLATLTRLFVERGPPEFIRSDNGPEFTAASVRSWLGRVGVQTAFIEPGSPWENGYNESFNGKLRDASEAMGESPTERRDRTAAQRRDLLHAARGAGHHRRLAAGVQRLPPAQFAGTAPTGPGGAAALRTDCGLGLALEVVPGRGAGQSTERRLAVFGNGSHAALPRGRSFQQAGANFGVITWVSRGGRPLAAYPPFSPGECDWVQCIFALPAGLESIHLQLED